MTDLRDLRPDRPIRWPVRLTPEHQRLIYALVSAKRLPPWRLPLADWCRLDTLDDVLDLYADLSTIPGINEAETPEHDLYATLAEIASIEARNGPAGQLPWRAP